ncbi:MAG: Holliday junction branch migration protein RuvA [Acidaminococcales bacterium]|jgi:Holliday junction DNA helicase RuvA|nr:Holliday junction branch migration protein RuvA [Acidaminococcales bacterium]
MIGSLKGRVTLVTPEYSIVETGGVGYRVFMTSPSLSKMELDREAKLYVHTAVREDAIWLYGFFDYDEYKLFLILLGVSGIGPRGALSILSFAAPDAFRVAVLRQDVKALTRLPGVGKKTAERLLLELRDKLGFLAEDKDYPAAAFTDGGESGPCDEAAQALLALGYSSGEIMPVLKKTDTGRMTTQEIIKAVLKGLSGR